MQIQSFLTAGGADVPIDVTELRILGYSLPGDGGGGWFVESALEPESPVKFQALDLRWFQLAPFQDFAPEMFGATGDGTTDDWPAIQAALDLDFVTLLTLRERTYAIGTAVSVPAGKTLRGLGADVSVLKRLPYDLDASGPHHGVIGAGDNVTLQDFTYNGDRAGDGGVPEDRCHGVVMMGMNFRCENVYSENATGYAHWASSEDDPVSGLYIGCQAWNSNTGFEQVGDTSAGVTLIDCRADASPRDGGTGISFGTEALLHQYGGASNVTAIRFLGTGETTGFLPLCNDADLIDLTLIDCKFDMTGHGNGLICVADGAFKLRTLSMIGCRFYAPEAQSGAAALFKSVEGMAIGCTFEGPAVGVSLDDGGEMTFTQCESIGRAPVGGSASAFGVLTDGTGRAEWSGGILTAEGPLGLENPWRGNVRVSGMTLLVQVTGAVSDYAPVIGPMVGGYVSQINAAEFVAGAFKALTVNGTGRLAATSNLGLGLSGRGVTYDMTFNSRAGATAFAIPANSSILRTFGAVEYNLLPGNYANDAAAAAAGVPIGRTYRNGSQLMVRVA